MIYLLTLIIVALLSKVKAVDAFTVSWAGDYNCLFPPPYPVPHVLHDRGEDGTLLVLEWHSAPWWPLLVATFCTTGTLALLLWLLEACLLPYVTHYSSGKDTVAGDTLEIQCCPCWLVPCTLLSLLLFELHACYGHLFVFTQLLWLISCLGS